MHVLLWQRQVVALEQSANCLGVNAKTRQDRGVHVQLQDKQHHPHVMLLQGLASLCDRALENMGHLTLYVLLQNSLISASVPDSCDPNWLPALGRRRVAFRLVITLDAPRYLA